MAAPTSPNSKLSPKRATYEPADEGLAKYFLSMLDDADRNKRYGEAIKAAIAEFVRVEGRKPRILDIGVGTGMLSCLCVLHGAHHVTGVDVNRTMVNLAKESLSKVDPTGKRFKVKLVRKGASQLKEEKFDMFVSEILGTLTTSESMYKYIAIYAKHLNTFGGDERRVYCVPRSTTQFFCARAFDRDALGPSLAAALESAVNAPEAARRLVPTNEGGIGLHLQLYPNKIVGERLAIHHEAYDRLHPTAKGGLAFALPAEECTRAANLDAARLTDESKMALGVFEWEVELWRGIKLSNTFEEYKKMDLRNQLARGSAWGFFVTALPEPPDRHKQVPVRALALNPQTKSTPELVIGGERIGGNVCDSPMPFVTAAADKALADTLVEALGAHFAASPLKSPRKRPNAAAADRILIVDDITCGALPLAAVKMGLNVDVVCEDGAVSEAGKEAFQAGALMRGAPKPTAPAEGVGVKGGKGGKRRQAPLSPLGSGANVDSTQARRTSPRHSPRSQAGEHADSTANAISSGTSAAATSGGATASPKCEWSTGHVDVEPEVSRKTRSVFSPAHGPKCYSAIVFPAAMLHKMRSSHDEHAERALERAAKIAELWLKPKGVCLPALNKIETPETEHTFVEHSLYTASVPDPVLASAGVYGALFALGVPCASGGALQPSVDGGGVLWHGVHTVELAKPSAAKPAPGGKRGKAAPAAAAASAGVIEVGVVGVKAEMGVKDAKPLEWGVSTFQRMVDSRDEAEKRSAVARAMYVGVQLRMQQEEAPRPTKKARAA